MMIRFFILSVLVCLSAGLKAQHFSQPNQRFSVIDNKACHPFVVTISAGECTGNFSCSVDYGKGLGFESLVNGDTVHYTKPGIYEITVVFGTTGNEKLSLEVTRNIKPEFDIYACSNNAVQVKINNTDYDQYDINYNDGTPTVSINKGNTPPQHNYPSPEASRTISVNGRNLGANNNCDALNKIIDTKASLPPRRITQLTILDNSRIQLDFETGSQFDNVLYKLEVALNNSNGAGFQQLRDIYNTNSIILENLNPVNNYYCFRLGTNNACDNTTTYIGSNIICSARLNATALNNNNQITWITSAVGATNFSIVKNMSTTLSAPANATFYNDSDIQCGTEYCYQLITEYGNNVRSLSIQKCITAVSDDVPPAVKNITAVIDQNTVDLQWQQDPAFAVKEYTITKSANGTFSPFGTSTTPAFSDTQFTVEAASCYQISYSDVCGNVSPASTQACPIILTGTLEANNAITLTWTPYSGWENGVNRYVVEKYDATGQLIQSIDASTALTLMDDNADPLNQIYTYRILAYPNDADIPPAISNTLTIIKEPNLYFPTAFTPNNDGLNDIFLVFSQYTAIFEIKIFNRWGEMLFISNDPTIGWDGTYKGNRMPEGTYAFTAKITDLAGRTFDRSGTVVLLKK